MAIHRQVVLHCTEGNHNKYYEITIADQKDMSGKNGKDGQYFVRARWGRIEHFKDGNPQSQTKESGVDWDDAVASLGTLMYAKLKKGYKTVKDTASGHQADQAALKGKKAKATPEVNVTPFERTEHQEVAINWWDTPIENIEERSI